MEEVDLRQFLFTLNSLITREGFEVLSIRRVLVERARVEIERIFIHGYFEKFSPIRTFSFGLFIYIGSTFL